MFEKTESTRWLDSLESEVDAATYSRYASQERNMWCTASFLHASDRTVEPDGSIVGIEDASDPVFEFIPVTVSCDERFLTTWSADSDSRRRFILQIRDTLRYSQAMKIALAQLVTAVD
jgi:hypothetical protein